MIDLMSKAIAKKARVDQEKSENRQKIETMVRTRIAESDQKIKITRDSLSSGFKKTDANS